MAEVTVLMICRHEGAMVEASAASVHAQEGVDAELRVIANGADTATRQAIARSNPAHVVDLPREVSYADAYNRALAEPSGEFVLLLNADCFLDPGFCRAAAAALRADERAGSVQGKLIRTTGPSPSDRLDEIDSVGLQMRRTHRNTIAGHGLPAGAFDRRSTIFGADGAAAFYRRRVLDDVALGGEVLDPGLESYGTDVDLAWRAWLHGWSAIFEPSAVAYHVRSYSPSTRERVAPELRRLQFRNRYLMMLKNETPGTFLRHLPWIAGFELLAFGHALLRERFLLRGYVDAARLAPQALRRRREDRARRTGPSRPVATALAGLVPPAR